MAEKLIPGGGAFQETATGAQYLVPGGGGVSVEATAAAAARSHYHVDDIILLEPNLDVPGKKPVGPVKVDRSHPLGASCVSAIIDDIGYDIASGEVYSAAASVSRPKDFTFTANTAYNKKCDLLTKGTFIAKTKWLPGWATYSGPVYGYYTSESLTQDIGFSREVNVGYIVFRSNNNVGSTSNIGAVYNNIWYTFGASWNSVAKFAQAYREGKYVLTHTMAGTAAFSPNSLKVFRDVPTDSYNTHEYMYMFDRTLSEGEHAALYADPYQFLIPA